MLSSLPLKIFFIFIFFSKTALCLEDINNIKIIENYLNSINTISSEFIQTSADGEILKGKFLLKKPGKMFFEYDKPSNIVIVSNNNVITIFNKLFPKSQQKYPLSLTPLNNLTKKINFFEKNILKNELLFSKNILKIVLFDHQNPKNGELELTFSKNPIELKGWKYTTFSKEQIEIIFINFKKNIFISDENFDYDLLISRLKK